MSSEVYRLTFWVGRFCLGANKTIRNLRMFFGHQKKATRARWPKGKSGSLTWQDASCSADGDDYPQAWPGSEINSGYAVDSQSPPCDEAMGMTPGVLRTRKVRHGASINSTA
ncbi:MULTISPECIES: hypothetical protein [unclassified Pseudomonas]|uniref:hypothetical protein n=1 Tax=Pseudomonas sp. PDC86 TaxID=1882759 RepID=UPI00115FB471|nr:hypothetical protein [Pseudomonas sp. PDC86]